MLRYCETIFKRYKDVVKYWLTFNEINCLTMPFGAFMGAGILLNDGGKISINKESEDSSQIRFQALHHQFIASAKAVKLGHEINQGFQNWMYDCIYDGISINL